MKMIVVLGMLFILSTQPLMMIMSLIFIVMMYSLWLFFMLSSYWFSYMLILVMMSGVLVVFTYVLSIFPNESFEISSLMMFILGMVFLLSMESEYEDFFQNMSLGSMKIWWNITMMMSLFLVIYLFIIMVMTVWMSMLERGSIHVS